MFKEENRLAYFNAIQEGDVVKLSTLLEAEPALLIANGNNSWNGLFTAIFYNKIAIVDILLAKGISLFINY
jgi:hypothetical protein